MNTGRGNDKESVYDRLFYCDSARIDIGFGLQKSFGDTIGDIEKALEYFTK